MTPDMIAVFFVDVVDVQGDEVLCESLEA